jgi:pilus assembly protein CpaD
MSARASSKARRRPLVQAVGGGVAMLAAVALAGCRDYFERQALTAVALNNVEATHPITFTRRTEQLHVQVPADGDGLAPNQEVDVLSFLGRYRAESQGKLRVSAPSGARGHLAATRALRDVQDLAHEVGIEPWSVEIVRHPAGARDGATLKLSYPRTVAIPPECGDWSRDVGREHERYHYPNFGCATQRNLALSVANPRDLIEPQAETPRSSERRSAAWSEYSRGGGGAGAGGASGGGTDAATQGGKAAPSPTSGGATK